MNNTTLLLIAVGAFAAYLIWNSSQTAASASTTAIVPYTPPGQSGNLPLAYPSPTSPMPSASPQSGFYWAWNPWAGAWQQIEAA